MGTLMPEKTLTGELGEWLFYHIWLFRDLRDRHEWVFRDQQSRIAALGKEKYELTESLNELAQALQAKADDHAATLLELATLKNKIVERAQVTPILRAKSSADVRRIVEQANEAEFEEQANGI